MDLSAKPTQLLLLAAIARRHYFDGKSKVEIADELGLSRFKVARLLDLARETGLVRIEIADLGAIDLELSTQLQNAFGLAHAVVVNTADESPATLQQEVGKAAGQLLAEIVTVDDVLGLAWSRSVSAMTNTLTRLPTVPVVQLTGVLVRPDIADSSVDLVRRTARIAGGAGYFFYAPTIVPDPATAVALHRQPEVAQAVGRFDSVTKAVVGIGAWAPGESTVYDATEPRARRELDRLGVCGEVAGVLVDADGRPVESELSRRRIGISATQLRATPDVIALAYGAARSRAVRAAVRGGLAKSVVTHASLADAMLGDGPLDVARSS
jgi:DNA-binding transcriptional regulator LsrR (DeoR family)